MAKVKLTKTELKAQTDALKRFQRFLPMLQLKKQQLQAEIAGIVAKEEDVARRERDARDALGLGQLQALARRRDLQREARGRAGELHRIRGRPRAVPFSPRRPLGGFLRRARARDPGLEDAAGCAAPFFLPAVSADD